jgi:hypothetical protein
MTYTRKQYLNKECSHREYYSQFVDDCIRARVCLFVGKDRILASTDEHLNDIPLDVWDAIGPVGTQAQWDAVEDYPTMAGRTCIYKEAAKQVRENNLPCPLD